MPTSKKPDPLSDINGLTKVLDEDGRITQLETQYRWKTFRFLFDNGSMLDVVAIRDDSDLRKWVLKTTGYPGIVGVAVIEGSDE